MSIRRLMTISEEEINEQNYITATYNGTGNINILSKRYAYMENVVYMYIDNVKYPAATTHNFTSTGNHFIKIIFVPFVINCAFMFAECPNLINFNLEHFDMSHTENLSSMFYKNPGLTRVVLRNLNWLKVTTVNSMFSECNKLTEVVCTNVNSPVLRDMAWMFNYCNIHTADLSGLNTTNVTNMEALFRDCWGMTYLKMMYPVDKVTNVKQIFERNLFARGHFYYNKKYNYNVIKTPVLWQRHAV